jgi:hypothetical protein
VFVPGEIYRWRRDLRSAAARFAEVVVGPGPDERTMAGAAALEIELGRDIRVRIAATAYKELASPGSTRRRIASERDSARTGFDIF